MSEFYKIIESLKKGGSIHIKPENKGKFPEIKKRIGPYVGSSGGTHKGSYPIPDKAHAISVLRLFGHVPNPQGIKDAIYRKYPELKKHQKGGFLQKIKTNINPNNWGVKDYSDRENFQKAYHDAKMNGEKQFMWNGERKTTEYKGTPEQEVSQYGINGKKVNPSYIKEPIQVNLFPLLNKHFIPGHIESGYPEYGDYDISYGPKKNGKINTNPIEEEGKAYYVYGLDQQFPIKKSKELNNKKKSDWNLFTNNCADNVCDAFNINRSRWIETPDNALNKISEKYPTLEVTNRTPKRFKELEVDAYRNIVQPSLHLRSNNKEHCKFSKERILQNEQDYLMSGQHHSTINSQLGIMNVQKLLNINGYDLDEDGIYGEKTKKALLDYQNINK